jgi:hypothetical protein
MSPDSRVRSRRSVIPAVLMIGFGVVAAIGVAKGFWTSRTPRPDLEVVASWWESTALKYDMRQASGRIRNNSSGPFDTVRVMIDLYDGSGHRIDTRTATLLSLQPHKEQRFTTWVLPGRPIKFRISSVIATGNSASSQSPSLGKLFRKGNRGLSAVR